MSTAAVAEGSMPAKGKKKLILLVAAAVLVLGVGGGGALWMMKKNAAAAAAQADAEGDADHAPARRAKAAPRGPAADAKPPVFVPLDNFTVNLADRDSERYAQVGVTLEIEDPKSADTIKAFMPAIRNRLLMAIADRTAAELLGRQGKERLAERLRRETARAMGYDVPDEAEDDAEDAPPAEGRPAKRKRKRPAPPALPIVAVHFSAFIVQ